MLQRGDAVPHFAVTRTDGSLARYADIWQRRNVVLVSLGDASTPGDAPGLDATAIEESAAALVVTREPIPGVPRPGVVIADRWGEIYFVHEGLPSAGEVLDWLQYIQNECPECQGEVR